MSQFNTKTTWLKGSLLLGASLSMLATSSASFAQDAENDEVIVTGIRQSLQNALVEKREADSLVEVILAEDIGKLPDQNLAEVLENITGIQITREAGVGTGVQIRGTDENQIQVNGVTTVGAGNDRGGISFEDIDASIIAGLEVIKAPESSTIEGAVGGTVNLRTIRPLDLKGTLASVRIQGEDSSLSQDGIQPRFSGALGNKWENASGQEIGFVLSGSYTQSDNSAFRPRLDRDNPTGCVSDDPTFVASVNCPAGTTHFLGVQFLNQVQINQEFETLNLAGSFEATPTPNLKLYVDGIYNDQTRRQESSRAQISNVSQVNGAEGTSDDVFFIPTAFDTFDLGAVPGPNGDINLGTIEAVTAGSFRPQQLTDVGRGNGGPFLRGSSDTGSRLTETSLIRLGAEWEKGPLTTVAEFSHTQSDTVNPNLSLTLNFINPNSDIFPRSSSNIDDNGTPGDLTDDFVVPGADLRDENGVPIIFDLRDGISFGIDTSSPFAPTTQQLLDPSNYVFDSGGTYSANERENSDTAVRLDFNYDFTDSGLSFIDSVGFGYRYNDRNSLRDDISASAGGTSSLQNSLNAGLIANLLAPIPDNFGAGTNSDLFISDLLHINPELALNPLETIGAINAAIASSGVEQTPISTDLQSSELAFFDLDEKTHALYGQLNFDTDFNGRRVRGNIGARYIDTTVNSFSTQRTFDLTDADMDGTPDDGTPVDTQIDAENSYSFFLPRANIAIDATDDIVLRGAYYEDINRPDFLDLTFARTLPSRGGVNDISRVGNPELEPEEIRSFDVSADWYFAPEGVFSLGYFNKKRSSLIGDIIEQPGDAGGGLRETVDIFGRNRSAVRSANANGAPCALGGVFSETTDAGIFGSGRGVCVGDATLFNAEGSTTQEGIEAAIQYNFADWEDRLGGFGWASGFGFIANYTRQFEDTNTGFINIGETRAQTIFDLQGFDRVTNPVSREAVTLLNLSENAYNLTGYYEKYGFSARLRYTWRDEFRTDDLPGTSNEFDPLGFRGVVEPRGQLNGSASYDITDNFTVSVDAVNITESSQNISCINDGALLCYEGITDRRVIFGASYTF